MGAYLSQYFVSSHCLNDLQESLVASAVEASTRQFFSSTQIVFATTKLINFNQCLVLRGPLQLLDCVFNHHMLPVQPTGPFWGVFHRRDCQNTALLEHPKGLELRHCFV